MDVIQPVKDLFNRAKSAVLSELQKIDPNDRKVQITAVVASVGTIYLCIKLGTRKNFWIEMPKYKKATADELHDPNEYMKIKRCEKPSDVLEIAFAKSGPGSMEPQTIQQVWDEAVANCADLPFCAWEELQDDDTTWKYCFKTWRQTDDECNRIAKALIGLGIKPFDIVNIIGSCAPMFCYLFFGVIFSGGIPGGCYTTNMSGSLKYICNLCKTKVIFAENRVQLNKYMEVIDELESVQYIVVYNEKVGDIKHYANKRSIKILSFNEFLAFGEKDSANLEKEMNARKKSANPKQCAILMYTSGTTGGSKGCMLSHDNIISMMTQSMHTFLASGGELPASNRVISFLPLSHIAGQSLSWWSGIYYAAKLNRNSTTYYCRKDWKKTMKISLQTAQPTQFVSVPRMYEKFYEAMSAGLVKASFIKRSMFRFVNYVGGQYYVNTQAGGSGAIPLTWPFVKKYLCDGAIKKAMGFGDCTNFISGGAPIAPIIRRTFASLNMPILDAYGLSETSGLFSLSRMNNYVAGAVGPIVVGSECLIDYKEERDEAGQGEICYRGRLAMMGYVNEPKKTAATFDEEGWFHTGDIGYLDEYDCLHITGRIKELLVTAGGENVAPVPVEEYIKKRLPALSQAIMIGDKKKYCSIIVSIACEEDTSGYPTSVLQAHAKAVNPKVTTVEEAINDDVWHEYIREGIREYNADKKICVSNSSKIQYFQILHKDLSVPDGTLSASMKIKRHKLMDVYANELNALYGDKPSVAVNPR